MNLGSSKAGEGTASVRGQQQPREILFQSRGELNRQQPQTGSLYLRPAPLTSSCCQQQLRSPGWGEAWAPPASDCSSPSQNHRIVGVGRDLCGSPSPTLLPKQGHLQQKKTTPPSALLSPRAKVLLRGLQGGMGTGEPEASATAREFEKLFTTRARVTTSLKYLVC